MELSEKTLNDFLKILPTVLYEYEQDQEGNNTILYMSPTSTTIIGYPPEHFIGHNLSTIFNIVHPDDRERFKNEDQETIDDDFFSTEIRILTPSGDTRWIHIRSKPSKKSEKRCVTWVGCIVDITSQIKREEEVKQLRGILPLCLFCKKIRDDKGYWEQVDRYIFEHSEAEISHSICPDCMKKHYPEV